MDKSNKFTPSSEQACQYADDYWKEKLSNRDKVLKDIQTTIIANSKKGSYDITYKILNGDKDYLKEKLEEVGYKIKFVSYQDGDEFLYIIVSFK